MTISNKLTISRIVLTFVFMGCLFSKGLFPKSLALFIFLICCFTDYFDGYLAKKRNEVTNLGIILDPIADKVLTLGAFLAFVEMKLIPAWIVVIIVARELTITGLRLAALTRGEVIGAGRGGKHKTVSQLVSILSILVFIVIKEAGISAFSFWNPTFEYWYRQIIFLLMLVTVSLTVISGLSFIKRNTKYFINSDNI